MKLKKNKTFWSDGPDCISLKLLQTIIYFCLLLRVSSLKKLFARVLTVTQRSTVSVSVQGTGSRIVATVF